MSQQVRTIAQVSSQHQNNAVEPHTRVRKEEKQVEGAKKRKGGGSYKRAGELSVQRNERHLMRDK